MEGFNQSARGHQLHDLSVYKRILAGIPAVERDND